MPRLRTNNVFGTSTNNPLLVAGVTLNSAGLANLAAIAAPDVAVLTLDPNRVNGAPEIVHVTAHTGSATSATILRGQEGTAAREHPLGTFWVHAATVVDWGTDWATYAPSNTNVTVGNGTEAARFVRVGDTATAVYSLVFGSTTSFSGTAQIGLPVAAASAGVEYQGSLWILDSGTTHFVGTARVTAGGTQALLYAADAAGLKLVNATVPMTWATGDTLRFTVTYEV